MFFANYTLKKDTYLYIDHDDTIDSIYTKLDKEAEFSAQAIKALRLISQELPLKKAAAIVAELYGYKKNALYQFGLDNL